MNKIEDHTNGQLKKIVDFADKNGLTTELWFTLSKFFRYLAEGHNVILAPDHAMYSLFFLIKDGKRTILNGGMIYHGPIDFEKMTTNETFSVEVNPSSKPHWSIHT